MCAKVAGQERKVRWCAAHAGRPTAAQYGRTAALGQISNHRNLIFELSILYTF